MRSCNRSILDCHGRVHKPAPVRAATALELEESVCSESCRHRFQSANKLCSPNPAHAFFCQCVALPFSSIESNDVLHCRAVSKQVSTSPQDHACCASTRHWVSRPISVHVHFDATLGVQPNQCPVALRRDTGCPVALRRDTGCPTQSVSSCASTRHWVSSPISVQLRFDATLGVQPNQCPAALRRDIGCPAQSVSSCASTRHWVSSPISVQLRFDATLGVQPNQCPAALRRDTGCPAQSVSSCASLSVQPNQCPAALRRDTGCPAQSVSSCASTRHWVSSPISVQLRFDATLGVQPNQCPVALPTALSLVPGALLGMPFKYLATRFNRVMWLVFGCDIACKRHLIASEMSTRSCAKYAHRMVPLRNLDACSPWRYGLLSIASAADALSFTLGVLTTLPHASSRCSSNCGARFSGARF